MVKIVSLTRVIIGETAQSGSAPGRLRGRLNLDQARVVRQGAGRRGTVGRKRVPAAPAIGSRLIGRVPGIFFAQDIRLRMREELDFNAGLITSYGYEVYRNDDRLYWYDDFPHPHDASLATTFPHHKHVPPDVKHNRIPAPDIRFTRPNLPRLIQEIKELIRR